MKLLINNYLSRLSTEPQYFTRSIKESGGDCELWVNPQVSTFDIFDMYKPDVFVCHFQQIKQDTINYLVQNKNIDVVINVTGAHPDVVKTIETMVEQTGISCKFIFSNIPSHIVPLHSNKLKTVNIMSGLDVFQVPQEALMFRIGTAVVSTQQRDSIAALTETLDTYHLLGLGNQDNFDIQVDIPSLVSVFDKYDQFIIVDNLAVATSQVFFETSYRSNGVRVELNEEDKPAFDKFLSNVFSNRDAVDNVSEMIRHEIRKNHSCFNRTARLVKNIGDSALADAIIKKGEEK